MVGIVLPKQNDFGKNTVSNNETMTIFEWIREREE